MIEPILDLNLRHWQFTKGELTAIGTWIVIDPMEPPKPCMVIMRVDEENSPNSRPCVVTQDYAYQWAEETGAPAVAARTAYSYADVLRVGTDKRGVFMVLKLIHEHLGDLLLIPPAPKQAEQAFIPEPLVEGVLTNNDTGEEKEVIV